MTHPAHLSASDLPVVNFTDADTLRLVSCAYIDEPAMQPLVDTDEELAFLAEVEALTSPRQTGDLPVPDGLQRAELQNESHGYGWTYVNAAFCYTRADGNRFNGPERGAWYAAYGTKAAKTAQEEVVYHLTRELEATGVYDNITSYRELMAGFTTRLHDLNGQNNAQCLSLPPQEAYPAGQALARDILANGGNGLLYPSRRHVGGQCLVAFRPVLVQNVRPGNAWIMQWSGSATPSIRLKT
ncbi:MAG: RES family NAD+ phosphorylase [Rhodobacteraceae bacterium]|nr:RES family NAD+ phosphorylase [Paracoccaceae bacterium]